MTTSPTPPPGGPRTRISVFENLPAMKFLKSQSGTLLAQELQKQMPPLNQESNFIIQNPAIILTPLQKTTDSPVIQATPDPQMVLPESQPTASRPTPIESQSPIATAPVSNLGPVGKTPTETSSEAILKIAERKEPIPVTPQEGIAPPVTSEIKPANTQSAAFVKEEAKQEFSKKSETAPNLADPSPITSTQEPAVKVAETSGTQPERRPEISMRSSQKPAVEASLHPSLQQEAVKGAFQGAAGTLVTAPVDARIQQKIKSRTENKPTPPLSEAFKNYRKVVQLAVPGRIAGSIVFMIAHPPASSLVSMGTDSKFLQATLPYGGCAAAESVFMTPISIISQNLRTDPEASSIEKAVKKIHKLNGFKGFYRGNAPHLAASMIYNMIFFPGTKSLSNFLDSALSLPPEMRPVVNFASGFIVGSAAVPVTMPIYRVIIDQRNQQPGTDNPPQSFVETAGKILKKGAASEKGPLRGVLSEVYVGIGNSMVRMALLGATIMAVNELVRVAIESRK